LYNFTGHRRDFLARASDLENDLAEEWIGTPVIEERFIEFAQTHFGASKDAGVALFNRSAAGIVSTLLAMTSKEDRILAIAPKGRTHPSIRRGASLAGAKLVEIDPDEGLELSHFNDTVMTILTRVTSELDILNPEQVQAVIAMAKEAGSTVFVDDAYGTRVGPALLDQKKTLALGVDFGITSCDKAGLGGPRAGLMVGRTDLVDRAVARASELGLEARGPLILGVLRSLELYKPETLLGDSIVAREIARGLKDRFGPEYVHDLCMGPTISEEDVMTIALEGKNESADDYNLVPAEASCILGMVLLEDYGIITSNVAERPGARVSLRLRPTAIEVERFGGPARVVDAVDSAFGKLRMLLGDDRAVKTKIFGTSTSI
jgi:L-seryl-tRNA(Ser) seleniumtransferase